jgi:hypothetical protein
VPARLLLQLAGFKRITNYIKKVEEQEVSAEEGPDIDQAFIIACDSCQRLALQVYFFPGICITRLHPCMPVL